MNGMRSKKLQICNVFQTSPALAYVHIETPFYVNVFTIQVLGVLAVFELFSYDCPMHANVNREEDFQKCTLF